MSMRKWECYQNEAKIPVVKQIIDKFPAKKWIIFNKSIKFAESIKEAIPNSEVYHSKMNTEDREKVLENFRTNKTRYLIAVDALNEGLNVPDADGAICVSGVSKQLVQQQTLGRVTRHRPDKTALYINLVSNSTVEESWVKKRVAGIKNVRWINNLNAVK